MSDISLFFFFTNIVLLLISDTDISRNLFMQFWLIMANLIVTSCMMLSVINKLILSAASRHLQL